MRTKRTKAKPARRTSGKVKTAATVQKQATGQRRAKAAASGGALGPVDIHTLQPESGKELERQAIFKRRRADEHKGVGDPETNVISRQLEADIEALLSLAIRLRTAAEARLHNPPKPGFEDPLVFGEAVAKVIPQLARATSLLVEFLNIDCDQGGLATGEVEAARAKALSWPDLYFQHAGAQASQAAKYASKNNAIGTGLPFFINQGKGEPSAFVRAAVHTLGFVYSNLLRFAAQPAGLEGDENPLRAWVRKNQLIELCKFVVTMRYAPDRDRRKAVQEMQAVCPGWQAPPWLGAIHERESEREFADRNWSDEVRYKIMERIEKYQEQLQPDMSVAERRVDFTAWAPELKQVLQR
jgi:hypothetical protein